MAWFEAIKKELGNPCSADTERMNLHDQLRIDPKATASWKLDILNTDKYTRTATRRTAKELFRAFQRTSRSERSPAFIEKARLHLTLLHSYNNIVQLQKKRYPRTKWMFYLLCRYVALEFEGLGPNPDPNNCEAEYLVLVLENILSKYFDVDPEIRGKVFIVYIIVTAYRNYQIPRWYMERLARLVLKGTIIQKQLDDIYSGDDDLLYLGNIWSNDNLKYFMELDDFATDDEDSDTSDQEEPNDFLKSTKIFPSSSSSSEVVESEDDDDDDALLINFEKNLLEYDFTRGLKDSFTVRFDASKEGSGRPNRSETHKISNADDLKFPIASPHVITIDDDEDELSNQLDDSDVEVIDCVCQVRTDGKSERSKFDFQKSSELICIDDDDDDDVAASGYSARNFVFPDNRSIVQMNSITPSTINSRADETGIELPQATSRNQSKESNLVRTTNFLSPKLDSVKEGVIATPTKPKEISSIEVIDYIVKPPSLQTSSTSSIKVKHKSEITSTVLKEISPNNFSSQRVSSNISKGENGISTSVEVERVDSTIPHSNSDVEVIQIERDKIKRSGTERMKDTVAALSSTEIEDKITEDCVITEEKCYQTVDTENTVAVLSSVEIEEGCVIESSLAEEKYYQTVDTDANFLESLRSNAITTKPNPNSINTINAKNSKIKSFIKVKRNVEILREISSSDKNFPMLTCQGECEDITGKNSVQKSTEKSKIDETGKSPKIPYENVPYTKCEAINPCIIDVEKFEKEEASDFEIEDGKNPTCENVPRKREEINRIINAEKSEKEEASDFEIEDGENPTCENVPREREEINRCIIVSEDVKNLKDTSLKSPCIQDENIQEPSRFQFEELSVADTSSISNILVESNLQEALVVSSSEIPEGSGYPVTSKTPVKKSEEHNRNRPIEDFLFKNVENASEGDSAGIEETSNNTSNDLMSVDVSKIKDLPQLRHTLTGCQSDGEIHYPSERCGETSEKYESNGAKDDETIESERPQEDIETMETILYERPQEDIKARFEAAETIQSERSEEGTTSKDQFEATETVRSEIPRKDKTKRSKEDKLSKDGKAQFKATETVRSEIPRKDKTEDKTLKDIKAQFETMDITSNAIKAQECKDYKSRDTSQQVIDNSVKYKLQDLINGEQCEIKDFAIFENRESSRKMYTSNGVNKSKARRIEEPGLGSEIIEASSNIKIANDRELAEQKIFVLLKSENGNCEDLQMNNLSSKNDLNDLEEEILMQHNKSIDSDEEIEDIELNCAPTIVSLEEEILKQYNKSIDSDGDIDDFELNSVPTIVSSEEEILKQYNNSVDSDGEIEDIELNSVPTITEECDDKELKSVDRINDAEEKSIDTFAEGENRVETMISESQSAEAAVSHKKIGDEERPKRPSRSADEKLRMDVKRKIRAEKREESGNLASHRLVELAFAENKELIVAGSAEERQESKMIEEGLLVFAENTNINEEFLELIVSGSVESQKWKIEKVKNRNEDVIIIESESADEDGPNLNNTLPSEENYRNNNKEGYHQLSMISTEKNSEDVIIETRVIQDSVLIDESIINYSVQGLSITSPCNDVGTIATNNKSAENKFVPNLNAIQLMAEDIFEETISVPDPVVEIEILGESTQQTKFDTNEVVDIAAPTQHGDVFKAAKTSLDKDHFISTSLHDDKIEVQEIESTSTRDDVNILTRVSSTSLQNGNVEVRGMKETSMCDDVNIPTASLQNGNVEVRGIEQTFVCDNVNISRKHVSSTSPHEDREMKPTSTCDDVNIPTATTAGETRAEDTTDCGYTIPEIVLVTSEEDKAITSDQVAGADSVLHQNYDLEKIPDHRDESAWESLQRNMRVLSYAVETKLIQESRSRVKFSSKRLKESEAGSKSRKKAANARTKSATGNISKLQSGSRRTGGKGIDENLKPMLSLKKRAQFEEPGELQETSLEKNLKKSAQFGESEIFERKQLEEKDWKKSAQFEESNTFQREQLEGKNIADANVDFINKNLKALNSNDDSSDSFEGRLVIPDDESTLIDCSVLPTMKKKPTEIQKVETVPTKMMHEMEIQPEPVPSLAEAVGQFSVCQDVSKFVDDSRKRTNYHMDYILGNLKPKETRRETVPEENENTFPHTSTDIDANLDVNSLPYSVNNLLKLNARMNPKLINSSDAISKNPEEILKKNVRTTKCELINSSEGVLKKNATNLNSKCTNDIDIAKESSKCNKKSPKRQREFLNETKMNTQRCKVMKNSVASPIASERQPKVIILENVVITPKRMNIQKNVERIPEHEQNTKRISEIETFGIEQKRMDVQETSEIERNTKRIEQNSERIYKSERNTEIPSVRTLTELSRKDDAIVEIEDESKTKLPSKPDTENSRKKLKFSNIDECENQVAGYSVEDENTQKQTCSRSNSLPIANYDFIEEHYTSKKSERVSDELVNLQCNFEPKSTKVKFEVPGLSIKENCGPSTKMSSAPCLNEKTCENSSKIISEHSTVSDKISTKLKVMSIETGRNPLSDVDQTTQNNASPVVKPGNLENGAVNATPGCTQSSNEQNGNVYISRIENKEKCEKMENDAQTSKCLHDKPMYHESSNSSHNQSEAFKTGNNDVQTLKPSPPCLQDKPMYHESLNSPQPDASKTGKKSSRKSNSARSKHLKFDNKKHTREHQSDICNVEDSDAIENIGIKSATGIKEDSLLHIATSKTHETSSGSSCKIEDRKSSQNNLKISEKTNTDYSRSSHSGTIKVEDKVDPSPNNNVSEETKKSHSGIIKIEDKTNSTKIKSSHKKKDIDETGFRESLRPNDVLEDIKKPPQEKSSRTVSEKSKDEKDPRLNHNVTEEIKNSHSGLIKIDDKTNSTKIKSSHKKKDIDKTGSGESLRPTDILEEIKKPPQEKPSRNVSEKSKDEKKKSKTEDLAPPETEKSSPPKTDGKAHDKNSPHGKDRGRKKTSRSASRDSSNPKDETAKKAKSRNQDDFELPPNAIIDSKSKQDRKQKHKHAKEETPSKRKETEPSASSETPKIDSEQLREVIDSKTNKQKYADKKIAFDEHDVNGNEEKVGIKKPEIKVNEEKISKAAEEKVRVKKLEIEVNEEKVFKAAEVESCRGNSNLYKKNVRDEVKTHKRKRAEDNEQEVKSSHNLKLEISGQKGNEEGRPSCLEKQQKDAEKTSRKRGDGKFKKLTIDETKFKKLEVASKKSDHGVVKVIVDDEKSVMQTVAVEQSNSVNFHADNTHIANDKNEDEKSKTGKITNKIIANDRKSDIQDKITNIRIAGEEARKLSSKGENLTFNKLASSENFTRHKINAEKNNSCCIEEKADEKSDDLLGNTRLQKIAYVTSQSMEHPEQLAIQENKSGNVSASTVVNAVGGASGRIIETVSTNSNVRTISTNVSESTKHTKPKPATEASIINDAAANQKKKNDQGKILSLEDREIMKNNVKNFHRATKNNDEMVTNRSSSCDVYLIRNKSSGSPVEYVATNDESNFARQADEMDAKTKTSGKRSAEEISGEQKKKPHTDANKCKSRETSKSIDNVINSLRGGHKKCDSTKEENAEKRGEKIIIIDDYNEEPKTHRIDHLIDSPSVAASGNVIQPVPRRSEVDFSVTAARGNMVQPECDDEPVFDGTDSVTSGIIVERVASSSADVCVSSVSDTSTLGLDGMPFGEDVKEDGMEQLSGTQSAVANQDLSEQLYITSEDIFIPIVGKEEIIPHEGEVVDYYSGGQSDPRLSMEFANIVCNRLSVMKGLSNNSQSQQNTPKVSEIVTQLNAQGHSFPLANLGLADMEGINYNEAIWSPETVMKIKENFTPDTVKEIFLNKGDPTKSFEDGVLQTPRIIPAALENADETLKKSVPAPTIFSKIIQKIKDERKFYVKPKLSDETRKPSKDAQNIIADKANVKFPHVDVSKSKRKVEVDVNASKQNHRKRLSSQTETEVEKNENVKRSKSDDGYRNDLFDSLKKSDPKTLPLPSASSLGNNQDKSVKNSGNVRKPDELVKDVARKKTKPNVIGREEQEIYKRPTERRHSIVSGQSRKHTPDTSRNSKSVPHPMNSDKYKYHPGHSSGSVNLKRIPHQDNRYKRHEADSRSHADPSAKIDGRHRHRHYVDVPNGRVHGSGYYGSAHNRPLYTGLSVGSPHDRNWRDSYLDAHHYNWEEVTFPLPNLRKPSVQHQQQSSEAHKKEWYENFDKVFPRREDITFTIKKTDDGRN